MKSGLLHTIMPDSCKTLQGNESLEQGDCKVEQYFEKVYRLLEAHFTPLRQECIVQDPGPAEYKGLQCT